MPLLFIVVQLLSRVCLFVTPVLWHAKLPCPSLSPGICSNLCPLSQWCHLPISSSAALFSSCPESGSFPMSWLFPSGGQRIDAFEILCWRRLLRVSWIARRSNQSILKEMNPEYSLEALMLKLKHQYSGHLMRKANSLEKLWCWEWFRARGEGSNRGWHGWMALLTQWTLVWANSRREWRTGKPGMMQSMVL